MGATAAATGRKVRRAPPRHGPARSPVTFSLPASEHVALRAYRNAINDALGTLATAERLYVELADGVEAHRQALAAYGYRFPPTQARGFPP